MAVRMCDEGSRSRIPSVRWRGVITSVGVVVGLNRLPGAPGAFDGVPRAESAAARPWIVSRAIGPDTV